MKPGYIPYEEVAVLRAAIFFIKKGWCSPTCKKDRDENWFHDGGCASCHAWDVVEFLEKSIEYAKEAKEEKSRLKGAKYK